MASAGFRRVFASHAKTLTAVAGFAAVGAYTVRGRDPAHAEPLNPQAGNSSGTKGWFSKPWSSYQAVPALPDLVPGYDRVHIMRRSFYSVSLFTQLRDKESSKSNFVDASRKLTVMLFNEAMSLVPHKPRTVTTPVDGASYVGMDIPNPETELCIVSILRGADCMADEISRLYPEVPIGKILIQRDEETAEPKLFFSKLPSDIEKRRIVLVDPMLATGGTASTAVEVLREAGVYEQSIVYVSMVAAPEGIDELMKTHPQIRMICGEVDRSLNSRKYIVPGLGDFGDRFYGTVP